MQEIHVGVYGDHAGGQALTSKLLRHGYYWPTLKADAFAFAQARDSCQRYAHVPRKPAEELTPIVSSIPFHRWGINLIGPLAMALGGFKYAIVAVEYFTKWAEAAPLVKISAKATINFIKNHIIYRFGIPRHLVSDNGLQFDNSRLIDLCKKFGIAKNFSTPVRPQANGQVETEYKIIKESLKRCLDALKGRWAEELPAVLWGYRTTSRTTTGETSFSMAYGTEALIPVEVDVPSYRFEHLEEATNSILLEADLDTIDEKREAARLRLLAYQTKGVAFLQLED